MRRQIADLATTSWVNVCNPRVLDEKSSFKAAAKPGYFDNTARVCCAALTIHVDGASLIDVGEYNSGHSSIKSASLIVSNLRENSHKSARFLLPHHLHPLSKSLRKRISSIRCRIIAMRFNRHTPDHTWNTISAVGYSFRKPSISPTTTRDRHSTAHPRPDPLDHFSFRELT